MSSTGKYCDLATDADHLSGAPDGHRHGLLEQRIHLAADLVTRSPLFLWDWGEAIAIQGLMVASDATGEWRYREWACSRMDLWRQIHPVPFWPDHLGSGTSLLWQYERTGDPNIIAYAEQLGQHLASLPRARTGARLLRPDKPDIDHYVWVDSLYTDGPFLCELARITGNDAYYDEAADHTEGMCASLQDEATGLFAHRYDDSAGQTNGVFWGRGCGWAALGLGHTLTLLPETHPLREPLAARLRAFAETAAELQTSHGHWRAVLDIDQTLPESSTTALIAEGLALGYAAGALNEDVLPVIQCAWSAVSEEG